MDGERDPVVLSLCLKLAPEIMKNAPECIEDVAEEFFDVISCYFPISFKTEPDDPRGITSDGLAQDLKLSMGASPYFAPFAIPFFLEKFSSTQADVKIDTLNAMAYCYSQYGRKNVLPFATEIWQTLKSEIIRTTDNNILDNSLFTIGKIAGVLCEGNDSITKKLESISGVIDPVIKELSSPEPKLIPLFALIIKSSCMASETTCEIIYDYLIPQVCSIFSETSNRDKKAGVLTVFSRVLESMSLHQKLMKKDITKMKEIVFANLMNDSLQNESINVLTRIIFYESQDSKSFEHLFKFLLDDLTISITLSSLEWIVLKSENIVSEKIIIPISKLIPKQDDISKILNVLVEISKMNSKVSSKIIDSLFFTFGESLKLKQKKELLSTISKLLSTNLIENSDKFIQLVLDYVLSNEIKEEIEDISKIILSLQKSLSSEKQKSIITILESKNFIEDIKMVPIFTSLIIPLHLNVEIPNFKQICLKLIENSTPENIHCLSSIINKMKQDETYDEIIKLIIDTIMKKIDSQNSSETRFNGVCLSIWMLKALSMSGKYQIADKFSKIIYDLLEDSLIGTEASKAFEIVLKDYPFILHKNMNSIVQILYKQRFFTLNLGKILELFKNGNDERILLISLSYMVKNITNQMLLNEIDKIFPLLLKAITSKKKELIEVGFQTLLTFIQTSKSKIETNLDTIIDLTLQYIHYKESMYVRMNAIHCLIELSAFPYQKLFPYYNNIMESLDEALDDPKRDIRKEVIICKDIWLSLSNK